MLSARPAWHWAALADANEWPIDRDVLFVALFFFVSCFAMSRYSLWLEHRLNTEQNKGLQKWQSAKKSKIVYNRDMHKNGNFMTKAINLEVTQGERIVICGPSGSIIKLIRCINRLEVHQRGIISINGTELSGDLKKLETIRSDVGMVFQSFNLFPHLTVLENCTLAPIWVRKLPKREAEELAVEYLTRVKIPEQALKYPGQLSGGQQQRVAIADRFACNPKLCCLTSCPLHLIQK